MDSRNRPIPSAAGTARNLSEAPVVPSNPAQPFPPSDTLSSQCVSDVPTTTPPKPTDQAEFEHFNLEAGIDDFETFLVEYGRSFIRSAMYHNRDEEVGCLETDIFTAKERVIAHYGNSVRTILADLDLVKEALSEQRAETKRLEQIEAVEEEKSVRIQDLESEVELLKSEKKQAEGYLADKMRYEKLLKEEQKAKRGLEEEVAGLKEDNKRKRDKMDGVWKKMERAVQKSAW